MEPVERNLSGAILDGRYRVIEPIAEGAMGVVYKAERVKLGRIVAIKVLHDELPNELSSRKRFEIEAMAMAKLEHPHCAAVLDVGVHEERPFVVMDFVSGDNLKELLADGPMPVMRAVEIARQVLSGLAHAHEHGIIHRDVKPANIVLSQKAGLGDHVKILDFGLARIAADTSNLTTGIVVGTPSYMAPEQIRGVEIDARADLYAVGILLCELLTGKKPFHSEKDDPIEVCSMHLKTPPPRLADLLPGVDFGPLEDVVAKALAKTPDTRFRSAQEMATALASAIGRPGSPITPPVGVPIRLTPPPTTISLHASDLNLTATEPSPAASDPESRQTASQVPELVPDLEPDLAPEPEPGPPPELPHAAASLPATPAPRTTPAPPAAPPPASASPPTEPSGRTLPGTSPFPLTRKQLAIGGAGVLAVIIVIAVLAGGRRGSEETKGTGSDAAVAGADDPNITMEKGDPAGEVLARANELVANGRRDAAIDLLASARKTYPDDARLPYLGGRLYFAKLWFNDGLAQLSAAVRLDPQYKSDPELIKTVLKGFNTTPRWDPALSRFLRETIGPAARPYLEETANGHPKASIRARATAELSRY